MASTSLRVEEEQVLVTSEGELDMAAAGGLRECLLQACARGLPVVLDFAAVTFVDSSALGVLASANRNIRDNGCHLTVINCKPRILTTMTLTGLVAVIDVRPAASADVESPLEKPVDDDVVSSMKDRGPPPPRPVSTAGNAP